MSRCTRKPTTWSKFSICTFSHKNDLHTLNHHHLKYKGYFQASYRDMTSQTWVVWISRHDATWISIVSDTLWNKCMKDKPQFLLIICKVKYFYSFDTYILKIRWKMCKLKAAEVHMHHKQSTSQDFPLPIYDVVLADYDVSPSCRFSHATAQYRYYAELHRTLVSKSYPCPNLERKACIYIV